MIKEEFRGTLGGAALCASLMLSLAAASSAVAQKAEDSWEKETLQKFAAIDAGGTVRVDNPFGNVYARFGGYENEVEILATIQRLDPNKPELKVDISRAGAGLEVAVKPGKEGVAETPDRVDLVLFVPENATLDVTTEDDLIEAKGLRGELIALSEKGDIHFRSIKGRVSAESSRGRISAMLEKGVTTEPQEFSTITGDIEVYIWEDADMSVDIKTSGEISTDFSMKIEHHRFEEPGKHAEAVVGKGGPKLSLYSKRGRVKLLRLQKHFKPGVEE
jgi:hypothetical protein